MFIKLFLKHLSSDEVKIINSNYKYLSTLRYSLLKSVDNKYKTKVNNFSYPSLEEGVVRIVNQVFPNIIKRIPNINETVTYNQICDEDDKTIDVYSRYKSWNKTKIDSRSVSFAFNHLKNLFKINEPYSELNFRESVSVLPSSTSAGYPFYGKKRDFKDLEEAQTNINKIKSIQSIDDMLIFITSLPTTIFHRFTPKLGELKGKMYKKFKIRQVFGVPFTICILEVMYLHQFINSFKSNLKNVYQGGLTKTQVSWNINRIRNKARITDSYILCGDLQGCDKSITFEFHNLLFSSMLTVNNINTKSSRIIKSIMYYLCNTPIIKRDCQVVTSRGSNTSGSWITNIINTYAVLFAITYFYHKVYNKTLNLSTDVLVQGDDFILIIDNESDAIKLKQIMLLFNLRLDRNKSRISTSSDPIDFLGFKWNSNNLPDQSDLWIVAKILYPERRIDVSGPYRIIIRYVSIIFNLFRGKDLFYKFLEIDKELDALYFNKWKILEINFVQNDGKIVNNNIPIYRLLTYGWRLL